jgi:hypothetical protein
MQLITTRIFPGLLLLTGAFAARAQAPVLVDSSPLPALPWVPATSSVSLVFDQPLDPATIGRVQVRSEQYGGLRLVQAGASGTTLTLQPLAPTGSTGGTTFRPGETVTVQVPSGVRGTNGAAVRPYQYQFPVETTSGDGSLTVPALAPSPSLGANNTAYHLAFGDVNGDGRPDIVAAGEDAQSGGGVLYVLRNNGSGTFNQPLRTSAVGPSPLGVALGDLDGDGDLDAVTSSAGPNAVSMSVRLNDGTGTFAPPASGPAGGQVPLFGYCRGIALADIDGDGDLDALVGNNSLNTITIRLNDGAARFSTPAVGRDEVAVGAGPYRLAVADLDRDGDLDLVAGAYFNNAVSVRLNDGTGLFSPAPITPEVPVGTGPWTVALGDVNNDGTVDLVSCNDTGNSVSVRLNDGTGTFTAPAVNPNPSVPGNPQSFALGDMDADGDLDLTVCTLNGSQSARVLFNDGTGNLTFSAAAPGVALTTLPYHTALADLDGDGDLDLATCGLSSPTINVRLHQPASPPAPRLSPNSGPTGKSVILSGPGYGTATAVRFNGTLVTAPLRTFGPNRVLAVVPAGATTGSVTLTLPSGPAASPAQPFVVSPGVVSATRPPAVAGLLLYPNPAHTTLVVQASASPTTRATLTLCDALGRRVFTQQVSLSASGLRHELNLTGVPPGLYALRVQMGEASTSQRVVVE